jgi:hypothetical protein
MYDIFSIVGAVSLAVSGGAVLVNLPQVERLVPGDSATSTTLQPRFSDRPAGLAMPAPDADIAKGESLMC